MNEPEAIVSNWGNYPYVKASITHFSNRQEAQECINTHAPCTPRGAGLSYGDASLGRTILSSTHFNKILSFDPSAGIVKAEAGATLDSILTTIVPAGWFLPVTPGTKYITLGGAVAGDIHGKNHHNEGSFCTYVTLLEILLADGSVISCNKNLQPEIFESICGGMGLGALILTVTFTLKRIASSFIQQRNVMIGGIDEMLTQLQEFSEATYSVAWIDCLATGKDLGRGVLMLGEHAPAEQVSNVQKLCVHKKPRLTIPFFLPSFVLNRFTVKIFNTLYFHKHNLAKKESLVHYDAFFYPLDFIRQWNHLYGRRGFVQYQFVLPFQHANTGFRIILEKISNSGSASFLAVLKALGKGENLLSFPMPGFTLALDFPVSDTTFTLLKELDAIIIELGGRIYLAKDARMEANTYWKGYSNATEFKKRINKLDPQHTFSSALSKRLTII